MLLVLVLLLVLILFVYNVNADLYCRIIEKEIINSNVDLKINALFIYPPNNYNNYNNAATTIIIDCKAMQDNILECNKIGADDYTYELKCDARGGLLQLNCTTEYNPINPNDKSNIKCNPTSDYYNSYASYTSSRRKLQDSTDGDSLLLSVWSQSNMQIHINDKLVFEGSGITWDQPWNLLKVNPLVDTFSITLERRCWYGGCGPGGFQMWLNGQAIDWSHFKCPLQSTWKSWHWFPFDKMTTYDDSDWPKAVDQGNWGANFRKHMTW
jgi:hypothetical protein